MKHASVGKEDGTIKKKLGTAMGQTRGWFHVRLAVIFRLAGIHRHR
jgi:hypothetical protein